MKYEYADVKMLLTLSAAAKQSPGRIYDPQNIYKRRLVVYRKLYR